MIYRSFSQGLPSKALHQNCFQERPWASNPHQLHVTDKNLACNVSGACAVYWSINQRKTAFNVKFEESEREGIWGSGRGRGCTVSLLGVGCWAAWSVSPVATALASTSSSSSSDRDCLCLGIGEAPLIFADPSVLLSALL